MKTPKERNTLDLIELVCELSVRNINFPSEEMHNAYWEARKELESRVSENKMAASTVMQTKDMDEEALRIHNILKQDISAFGLVGRSTNCLKAADITTLADVVSYSSSEMLMKFRGFGKKSCGEIENLVTQNGLSFGMDVTKYGFVKNKYAE